MSTREVEFTGSIVDTSTLPTAQDATSGDDIPTFRQVARRSSWYDSTQSIADLRAIDTQSSTSQVTNNGLFFVDDVGFLYKFDSASSATDDGDTIVKPTDIGGGSPGRYLKLTFAAGAGAQQDTLVQQLDTHVSSIRAGEAIANRDCIGLETRDQDNFLYFKTDADVSTKTKNFLGFAKSAATVTAGTYSFDINAAFVTGNVAQFDVNGDTQSVTFSSSSDETLDQIAQKIANHPDVASAASIQVGIDKLGSDDREIAITGSGGITILIDAISVTGGASQPVLTFSVDTAATSDNLEVHNFGPLNGFTGLIVGNKYYVSTTAGGVTDSEPANSRFVGTALASTIMFVHPWGDNTVSEIYAFKGAETENFWKSNGASGTGPSAANGTATHEKFDFTSWLAATAHPTAKSTGGCGDGAYSGKGMVIVGGWNTSSTLLSEVHSWDSATWTTEAGTPGAIMSGGVAEFGGNFLYGCGQTGTGAASRFGNLYEFNGSTWADKGAVFAGRGNVGAFVEGGLYRVTGGFTSASANSNVHSTWDGASASTSTVAPYSGGEAASSGTAGGGYFVRSGNGTDSFKWTGSWSTAITSTYTVDRINGAATPQWGGAAGTRSTNSDSYYNGGNDVSGISRTDTAKFDGTSISSSVASTDARAGPMGGVFAS